MWRLLTTLALVTPWVAAQAPSVLVQGAGTSGQPQVRPNIDTIYSQRGPMWDIYIQGLAAMQKVGESQTLSYFQIAGVHGLPYVEWDGVQQASGAPFTGFCPHGEELFPSWHRPYLALYEQTLASHVQSVASQYNDASYTAAAQAFRVPFWDWGVNYNLPDATTQPTTTVRAANGQTVTVANPLYAYKYQQVPVQGPGINGPLAQYSETKRWPDGNGDSNMTAADVNLASDNLQAQVYSTFTRALTYGNMATTSSPGPSFEMPHNYVHDSAGGNGGDMQDVDWAAFDPLFWLHHANIDRYYALWQAVYYQDASPAWSSTSTGQFATPSGSAVNQDSPLKPFYKSSDGTFWTSAGVADVTTFGYTYPEIDASGQSASQLSSSVKQQVNQLYGSGSGSSSRLRRRIASNTASTQYDYSAELSVERSEVPRPASIHLIMDGAVVGRMLLPARPANGRQYASIPLQSVLQRQKSLQGMSTDQVIPFLMKSLSVQIVKKNGETVATNSVPSLEVLLRAQEMTPPSNSKEFPKFGHEETWTLGKPAKAQS